MSGRGFPNVQYFNFNITQEGVPDLFKSWDSFLGCVENDATADDIVFAVRADEDVVERLRMAMSTYIAE